MDGYGWRLNDFYIFLWNYLYGIIGWIYIFMDEWSLYLVVGGVFLEFDGWEWERVVVKLEFWDYVYFFVGFLYGVCFNCWKVDFNIFIDIFRNNLDIWEDIGDFEVFFLRRWWRLGLVFIGYFSMLFEK